MEQSRELLLEELTKCRKRIAELELEVGQAREHAEKKEQEFAELVYAQEKANHASLTKSGFLAGMSHEVRTPLNAVIGFSELLKNTLLDEGQTDFVNAIKESGETLLSLVNDILDLSKVESGKIELEEIDFRFDVLLESVITIISAKMKKNVAINYAHFTQGMPRYFKGDPTRIRQILLNILGNAAKFTMHGEVSVSVNCEDIVSPDDGVADERCCVTVTVRDTGVGIASDKMEHIFEPFVQGDSSTTRKFGGTGLGLAIVENLVKMMQGSVAVTSAIGKGSTFTVSMVLVKAVDPDQDEMDRMPLTEIRDKTIGFVDADSRGLQILSQYCQSVGVRIIFAVTTDDDAMQWLQAHAERPDIVVVDGVVSGEEGSRIVEWVRRDASLFSLKLIAVTGDAAIGSAKKYKDLHFDAYIPKPVKKEDFLSVLQTTLGSTKKSKQIVTKHFSRELALQGIKVLVVEDDPVNLKLLKVLLQKCDCVVCVATNGQEAIDKIRVQAFDIVLMDIQMPTMDGLAATRYIREHLDSEVPIIALTSAAQQEDKESALAAGMTDYLIKPIDLGTLKEHVLKFVR